jgi:hypothetical protein
MSQIKYSPGVAEGSSRTSGLKLFLIIAGAVVCALLITLGLVRYLLFPKEFVPTTLNLKEQRQLAEKLQKLPKFEGNIALGSGERLEPEPYSENGASREIVFSERELNGLVARDSELAHRFAIDLSDDLASGRLLIPLDPDFPLLGGKTLQIKAGLELAYAKGRPVVKLKGVSVWGVPLPNAWLGNLKNVDLIKEFGDQGGFWSGFAAGVEEIRVRDGKLVLRLKE